MLKRSVSQDSSYGDPPDHMQVKSGHPESAFPLTLRCSQSFIRGDMRTMRDFGIKYMSAIQCIELIDFEQKFLSFMFIS